MKLPTFMKNISKRTYAVATMALAAVIVPATLFAWGPSTRVTFTMAKPADYVTFNSITDNQTFGDERNFVQVRNATDNTAFGENVSLVPGKEYEVRAYYHNNASSSLNDAAHNYAGIATGAFMRTEMPSTVAGGADARITSYIGAANAKHLDASGKNLGNQVWDEAYGKNSSSSTIALSYIAGSAKVSSNGAINGSTISDTLFTTGAPLGYSALDGKVPGCLQYGGYVTYRFKVNQPNFTVSKQVRAESATTYSENVNSNAGDTVVFRIEYKDTGTLQQDGVVIRDQLPAGLEYVPGSTYVATSASNGQYVKDNNDTIAKQGLNVGSYAQNGNAYVKFSAKIASADKLACGVNTITNTAAADTANGSKSDTATVTITKDCPQPKDITVCRLSDKKIVTIKETDFDAAKYSKNLDDCKTVVEKVKACNTTTGKIEDVEKGKENTAPYTTDLSKCAPKPEMVTACNLDTKKIETVEKSKIDDVHYTLDLNKCKETPKPEEIQVCRLDDKKVVTITKDEYNAHKSKYSTDLNDCATKPTPMCPIPGKETMPKDSPDCKTMPVELPHTGIGDSLVNMLGAGSLVGMAGAFVASRRALKNN